MIMNQEIDNNLLADCFESAMRENERLLITY
nr:MAG TPA: SAMP Motif [Caudoviricetes sp.]